MSSGRHKPNKESSEGARRTTRTNIYVALIGAGATILAAVLTAVATFLDGDSQSKDEPGSGSMHPPTSGQATPQSSLPIPRNIACRPPVPRSQDTRVQGEVRNLIEATHQICVAHPDGKFAPPQAVAAVTSFVPAGDPEVVYSVKGDATGYLLLKIDGPRDAIGKWTASWQQNSSSDCWSQLIVTSPDGIQRENSTYTDCHPRR